MHQQEQALCTQQVTEYRAFLGHFGGFLGLLMSGVTYALAFLYFGLYFLGFMIF